MAIKYWQYAKELDDLQDALMEAEDPDEIKALETAQEQLLADIAHKTDGLYEYFSRSGSESERLGKEIRRLEERKEIIESRRKGLEGRVINFLKAHGQKQICGDFHRLVIRDNPPALKILDEKEIPAEFKVVVPEVVTPATTEIDKGRLKAALKTREVPGAELTVGQRLERK